jgi:ankyrin repeat protein
VATWRESADTSRTIPIRPLLLAKHADVNARNEDDKTALLGAAWQGHTDIVRLLIANRADVNAQDKWGGTPLHAAAHNGHREVATILLANKCRR